MGHLTPEMYQKIVEVYAENPSYERVASELKIDWRTVRKAVLSKDMDDQEN